MEDVAAEEAPPGGEGPVPVPADGDAGPVRLAVRAGTPPCGPWPPSAASSIRSSSPDLDTALGWLAYKAGYTKDQPLLRGSGPAGDTVEAIGELAEGATGIPLIGKFIEKVTKRAGQSLEGSGLERWLAERTGQQDFLHLREMTADEIAPKLPKRFIADLMKAPSTDAFPDRPEFACRVIVFLDTFESVRRGTLGSAQGHEREQWVRDLHIEKSPILLVDGRPRPTAVVRGPGGVQEPGRAL